MTCSGCFFAVSGKSGPDCPLLRIGVRPTFSAGCNLYKPSNEGLQYAILKCPTKPEPQEPIPTPAKCSDRGKAGRGSGKAGKLPNATEAEYARIHLAGRNAVYEGAPFRMANGHTYTPDWVVIEGGYPVEAHEVKGAYAFSSQCRARLAFDQCKIEFPKVRFFWAKKTKKGWKIK